MLIYGIMALSYTKYLYVKTMIYFDKVSKKYPNESQALQDINFSIAHNEFVSIV